MNIQKLAHDLQQISTDLDEHIQRIINDETHLHLYRNIISTPCDICRGMKLGKFLKKNGFFNSIKTVFFCSDKNYEEDDSSMQRFQIIGKFVNEVYFFYEMEYYWGESCNIKIACDLNFEKLLRNYCPLTNLQDLQDLQRG